VKVRGGPTLKLKESDRLEGLKDLLVVLGSETRVEGESLVTAPAPRHSEPLDWDTNHDHRLAFAAAVAALSGPMRVLGPHVVEKSYPRFWQDLRRLGFKLQPTTFPLDG
jgi:3-phosphoshikimate 1-carboxyvinyltransferase